MATDPDVYPETDVLKNLAGIEDPNRLQQFEAVSTAYRMSELRFNPIPGAFDAPHLQRIHRHIFQDVYSWAGKPRTVDIRKEGEFWFCRHEFIEQSLIDLFTKLSGENKLKATTPGAVWIESRLLHERTQCDSPIPRGQWKGAAGIYP